MKANNKTITVQVARPRNPIVRSLALGQGAAAGRHGAFKPRRQDKHRTRAMLRDLVAA